ncbi:PucR family transcriptional regulator [Cryobacterium aureum]|uniref:PucR family transcriptional regulator n=1 Tax=Cryobacterium aureum TaxID=995037 RepID=UPI000CF3F2D5|nr:helix-turn-helix domain-containing protein [Cryobacterium aureum]
MGDTRATGFDAAESGQTSQAHGGRLRQPGSVPARVTPGIDSFSELIKLLAGDSGVRRLVDTTLAALESADRSKKSQLVYTLAAYLEVNGNISLAARNLYLNRHSLIYRLQRIQELTGLDLDSPEDRLALALALRIRRLRPVELLVAVEA